MTKMIAMTISLPHRTSANQPLRGNDCNEGVGGGCLSSGAGADATCAPQWVQNFASSLISFPQLRQYNSPTNSRHSLGKNFVACLSHSSSHLLYMLGTSCYEAPTRHSLTSRGRWRTPNSHTANLGKPQ